MIHPLIKWTRTVRGRLMLLFALLVSLAIVEMLYLGLSIRKLDKVNKALLISNKIVGAERDLQKQLNRQSQVIYSYLDVPEARDDKMLKGARNTEVFEKVLVGLEEHTLELEERLADLSIQSSVEETKRACRDIRKHYDRLMEAVKSDTALNNLKADAIEKSLIQPVQNSINQLEGHITQLTTTLNKESNQNGQLVAYYVPIFMVAVIIVGGFIVIFTRKRLLNRLKEMEKATHYVTRGDFNHRIEISGRDELTDLAMAYNSMASRLSELDSLKREFISHFSHELKNPLAAIRQVNDFLSAGLIGTLNEKQKDLIRISQKNTNKLNEMLNNLLDISKIEAGVMEYRMEEEDLVSVVRNCIHEITPLCEEKNIKIGTVFVQPKLIFPFDKLRIGQVINNLLNNAVKFTSQSGMVIVRVDRIDSALRLIPERYSILRSDMTLAKGYAIISVEDTGIGVPEEELDNIFEKFYQIQNGMREHGSGTGLGLAISKSIVEVHEGFIWAEPGNRQGTNFRFVLPLDSKVATKTLHIVWPRAV